jgi:hypothetical protein
MIAALIFVISIATLLQFFVSYCRSVIAGYTKQELSLQGREITGIENRIVRAEEFQRLLQLLGLCPEPGTDANDIRAVRAYFKLLSLARKVVGRLAPAVADWAERERRTCAYFAAVALDRRIAYSRELMTQQISNV